MAINLSPEEKKLLVQEVQTFFEQEREETIGVIAAENILDFFLNNLGTVIYNKALDDARVWFSKKMENLETDFDLLYRYREK
ncbi:MAG: DUF2164 domain-containing protein [Firmicutes bacterium]|nr:DUF2164 domain-containing protein [Bacillota bacterium]